MPPSSPKVAALYRSAPFSWPSRLRCVAVRLDEPNFVPGGPRNMSSVDLLAFTLASHAVTLSDLPEVLRWECRVAKSGREVVAPSLMACSSPRAFCCFRRPFCSAVVLRKVPHDQRDTWDLRDVINSMTTTYSVHCSSEGSPGGFVHSGESRNRLSSSDVYRM